MGLSITPNKKSKVKNATTSSILIVKADKIKFTVLTKEQVEAGRPKDAYNYVI